MKKVFLSISILLIISLAACQQAAQQEVMEKKEEAMEKAPEIETTGEAVVDAVGNDLNNVDSVEKDLSADELSDLDAGLADVEKI